MPAKAEFPERNLFLLIEKLGKLDPNHELVNFGNDLGDLEGIDASRDTKAFEAANTKLFAERFWKASDGNWQELLEWDVRLQIIENYTKEVEQAIDQLSK